MSTWYCSLQPQIHTLTLLRESCRTLMLQSLPSLWEWGSCSNKIAPKAVGCGDPRVFSAIPGCSDTFLLCASGGSWKHWPCLPSGSDLEMGTGYQQVLVWSSDLTCCHCPVPVTCVRRWWQEHTLQGGEGGRNLCSCQSLSWVTGPAGCQCHTLGNGNTKSCLPYFRLCCRKWRWQNSHSIRRGSQWSAVMCLSPTSQIFSLGSVKSASFLKSCRVRDGKQEKWGLCRWPAQRSFLIQIMLGPTWAQLAAHKEPLCVFWLSPAFPIPSMWTFCSWARWVTAFSWAAPTEEARDIQSLHHPMKSAGDVQLQK